MIIWQAAPLTIISDPVPLAKKYEEFNDWGNETALSNSKLPFIYFGEKSLVTPVQNFEGIRLVLLYCGVMSPVSNGSTSMIIVINLV